MHTGKLQLTLVDTTVLKGLALLLLLCHHCWFTGDGFDDAYLQGVPVFKNLGIFCKVCVSIFVFLSGYGLTESTMKKGGIRSIWGFYRRRYFRLMFNYWLIYLIFVPLGVFLFGRTFTLVYGEHWTIPAIADFLGVHQLVMGSPMGYNPTWWFYSLIILLSLVYPVMWKYRTLWPLMIPCAFIGSIFYSTLDYCLPFICGMAVSLVKPELNGGGNSHVFITLLFPFVCVFRFKISAPVLWDTAIVLYIVYIAKNFNWPQLLLSGLGFLGKHSFNIFLFHTFIFSYYFHEFIYWSRNPILIVLSLLLVCIAISIAIERLKRLFHFERLQDQFAGH